MQTRELWYLRLCLLRGQMAHTTHGTYNYLVNTALLQQAEQRELQELLVPVALVVMQT